MLADVSLENRVPCRCGVMSESADPSARSCPQETDPSRAATADRRLPPQLYLAPLLVVVLLVIAWLVFSWSFHGDDDPQALVQHMRGPGHGNWQTAFSVAELLRNPRNEALRRDPALCRELASILDEQLGDAAADASETQFQVFLCRALGEFTIPDGLPSLLQAAEVSQSQGHVDVQCAALEAIAVLTGNVGRDVVCGDPRVMAVLLDTSRAASDPGLTVGADRVASTAAFTLGVVGGSAAAQRLRQLLSDRRPDVRYNAATGLARQRDPAAIPVLIEMLDTDSPLSLEDESDVAAQARKRALVISNAVRAVRLFAAGGAAERRPLIEALRRLQDAPELPAQLRTAVQAAQAELRGVERPLK